MTFSSQRFLVDVGMNARGPIVPLPLVPGIATVSISPRKARLLYNSIPEHSVSDRLNMMWQLEVQNHEKSPWISTYAFHEIEFLPVDFEMMNWFVTTNPRSFFTQKILVGRMILDELKEEIIGDVTLFEATLRRRIHGKVDLELECKSESERLGLLQEYFGIRLTQNEQLGISDKVSRLS